MDWATAQEYEVQAALGRELGKLGVMVSHLQSARAYRGDPAASRTTAGVPDLLLVQHGRVHLWEVKAASGGLNRNQVTWHRAALEHGYYVAVVRNLDDMVAYYTRQFNEQTKCPRCGYRLPR